MFVVSWVITTLAELFSVDLVVSIETTKEEDKKAEKTSSKCVLFDVLHKTYSRTQLRLMSKFEFQY
jgi:hypothetical protein